MMVRLEGSSKPYCPRDSDEVRCDTHGVVTTWGKLDAIQQLAVEEGLDTSPELECLLSPNRSSPCPPKLMDEQTDSCESCQFRLGPIFPLCGSKESEFFNGPVVLDGWCEKYERASREEIQS